MKDALKVFIPAFLLFAAVGAVAGYGARSNTATVKLYDALKVRQSADTYLLQFECEAGGWGWLHDVDTDKGRSTGTSDARLQLRATALDGPSASQPEYRALLTTLLGGATGGLTFRQVLTTPATGWTSSQIRRTIAGIIGAVTGYSLGYYAGSRYNTGCDSGLLTPLLDNRDVWIGFERAKIVLLLKSLQAMEKALVSPTGKLVYDWQEDPAFRCSTAFVDARQRLDVFISEQISNPSSTDFRLLERVSELHARVRATSEHAALVRLARFKFASTKGEGGAQLAEQVVGDVDKQWDTACGALDRLTRERP